MIQDTGFIFRIPRSAFRIRVLLHPASPILQLASCILFLATASVRATDYTSSQSGNWHDSSTWGAGSFPGAGVDNVTIMAGHTVTVAQASTAYTVSNLTVNGVLTHTANTTVAAPHYKIDLTILGDLTVRSNGAISAYGKGYASSAGPAPGYGVDANLQYGAAHGGMPTYTGGQSPYPYVTYGSLTNPTTLGSGGGQQAGGGLVILRVAGQTTIELGGAIDADAYSKPDGFYQSGGAGGSVNLATAMLAGGGVIRANGGEGRYYGGGGGRLAVRLTSGTSFGGVAMTAYGGCWASGNPGGAGTVYREVAGGGGEVIIDNNGYATPSDVTTLISTNVPERLIPNLTIRNGGKLQIQTNHTFGVTGSYSNNTQTGSLGGTFEVGGSGTSTIRGNIGTFRFFNFTCTNAGKRIEFQTGRTNQLDGVLTLAGAAGNEVKLAGLGTGTWGMKVPSPFAGSVNCVDVTNCDANAGATIAAYNSIDRGGNQNWSFATPGQINLWTGAASTNWGAAGNWSLGRLPVGTDVIRVTTQNNPMRWPVLNDHATLQTLQVETGARLSLGGKNLTVGTDFTLAGTLVASGGETVTLQGDADWTGGTFSNAQSTVVIGGTGSQALVFGGIAFNTLVSQNPTALTLNGSFAAVAITNTGGGVSFANAFTAGSLVNQGGNLNFGAGVTATNFLCLKPGVTITFKHGATYAITNLTLAGSAASPVTLVSSAPGIKWNLNVAGASHVSRVTVSDSDASGGLPIRPVASAEGTPSSTANWTFGSGAWKSWTGGSASFTNANNWNPPGVPDAGSRLYVETTAGIAAPVLGAAQTVGELAVGGVTSATVFLNAPLTVTGNVTVLPSGVLTHTNNAAVAQYRLDLTIGCDLLIAPGGAISAYGKGHAPGQGPAPGWSVDAYLQYGAAHGGMPTYAGGRPAYSNTTYGSVTNPTTLGSGGHGQAGGGAVILRVAGQTSLAPGGMIDVRGQTITTGFYQSGGSGGSVNLITATLTGGGLILADGGGGAYYGGGGGRIAVKLTGGTSFGAVAMTAYGGLLQAGWSPGAAGTLYRQTAAQGDGQGDLVVDNNGYSTMSDVTTLISTNVTDAAVGCVTVTGRGQLRVAPYAQLSISGSLTNDATSTFTVATNSTVAFVGSPPGTVWGNRSFYNLSILGSGVNKPLVFEAGKETKVAGALRIDRAALGSTVPGTQWYLTLDLTNGTQPVVARTMVQDSNASRGQTISITTAARDLGNNVNWIFAPGGTVIIIR